MDVLHCTGLKVEYEGIQCYDGAHSMPGKKAGIATSFKKLNVLMLHSHCNGHALNLAVNDAICKVEILKETFEITREIVKLVNGSLQRNTKLR